MTIADSIKDTANFGPSLVNMAIKYSVRSFSIDKRTTRFHFPDGSWLIAKI